MLTKSSVIACKTIETVKLELSTRGYCYYGRFLLRLEMIAENSLPNVFSRAVIKWYALQQAVCHIARTNQFTKNDNTG